MISWGSRMASWPTWQTPHDTAAMHSPSSQEILWRSSWKAHSQEASIIEAQTSKETLHHYEKTVFCTHPANAEEASFVSVSASIAMT
jgi:hypothetical protein